ncbi:MAG: 3-deoxy-8-phosphooctulonate synthase [Bdellovibrionales bacterium]|nr:3-deoxy-8-phosphooctulonate synthase [Bdellovibrionales bacterium]
MYKFSSVQKPVSFHSPNQTFEWGTCDRFPIFAGPDIVEDEGMVLEVAQELKKITTSLNIPWVFKCSFDKANRQSVDSFRGPGMEKALNILARVKSKVGCDLLTDVHETIQVAPVAEVADIIQIPAFLCRQTDLVVEAAKAGKPLHLKKGQFMAPGDMLSIAKKAASVGNEKVLLCDRGTFFGYGRLVNDFLGLVEMRALGYPVILDCTHSTQLPGATGKSSGGRGDLVGVLAKAGIAAGVDGLFLEVHPDPKTALCDGPTSVPLAEMEPMLKHLSAIWNTHKEFGL